MNNRAFARALNDLLRVSEFKDYAPNGLQVEGKAEIHRVIFGVTASQALIARAISEKADAIIVHHGYFWRGETPNVVGMKRQRLASLLANDINLYAYHLPLDCHAELGNNAQLAKQLNIANAEPMDKAQLLWMGELDVICLDDFSERVSQALTREPLVISGGSHPIKRIAWCSGGAQNRIDDAFALDADAYLTGEASEQTYHAAVEQGIHFIGAGHHATERGGIMALCDYCRTEYGLDTQFIDIDNPI